MKMMKTARYNFVSYLTLMFLDYMPRYIWSIASSDNCRNSKNSGEFRILSTVDSVKSIWSTQTIEWSSWTMIAIQGLQPKDFKFLSTEQSDFSLVKNCPLWLFRTSIKRFFPVLYSKESSKLPRWSRFSVQENTVGFYFQCTIHYEDKIRPICYYQEHREKNHTKTWLWEGRLSCESIKM